MKLEDTASGFPEELAARYEVLRELGRGGMGRVFLARDRELDRRVAIKVLLPAATPKAHGRLVREAQILADLGHPHVIRVLGFGNTEKGPYVEMEYLEGGTVDQGVMGRDPGELMLEVADALQAVHEAGVIHRDVKPSNILVTREGRAVLLDFGLALDPERTRLSEAEVLMGTLPYLAPEVLRGEEATAATDWYAWGLSLYVLREGRYPYSYDELVKELSETGRAPTPTFTALDPDGSEAQVIQRCLQADPGARPRSCRELRSALEGRGPPGPTRLTARPGAAEEEASGTPASTWVGLGLLVVLGFLVPDLVAMITSPAERGGGAEVQADLRPEVSMARAAEQLAATQAELAAAPELRDLFEEVEAAKGEDLERLVRVARQAVRSRGPRIREAVDALERGGGDRRALADASWLTMVEELLQRRADGEVKPIWTKVENPGTRRLLDAVVSARAVGTIPLGPGMNDPERVGRAEELLAALPGRWRMVLPRRDLVIADAPLEIPVTALQVIAPSGRRLPHMYEELEQLVPEFTEKKVFDPRDPHSVRLFLHRWSRSQLDVPITGVPEELPLTLFLVLYGWTETHHLELDLVGREETVRLLLSPWDLGAGVKDWHDPSTGVVLEVARTSLPEGLRGLRFRGRGMPGIGSSRSAVGVDQIYLRAR